MSAPAVITRDIAAAWRSQRGAAITLAVGVLALGLLFHEELVAAIHTWIASTAYNHCFLVIPDRRLSGLGPARNAARLRGRAGAAGRAGRHSLALAWLLAERLGIMEGRQLVAMSFVELLALAVLGWRLWWQLAGPLLYCTFWSRSAHFLTPKLQDITTVFVRHGLDLLHIPAYITGYTIEIPEGTFYIAEACAGLRFLIASIAFGVLYSLLMYRSPWRRVAFIAASVVVPIIANGMRAVGIVALGHVLGSAQAAATDHVLYGWMFFSLVILILIALGLPFREDIGPTRGPARSVVLSARPKQGGGDHWGGAAIAGFLVLLLAAVSPAVATQLDRAAQPQTGAVQALNFGPACIDVRPRCRRRWMSPGASSRGASPATGRSSTCRSLCSACTAPRRPCWPRNVCSPSFPTSPTMKILRPNRYGCR